MLNYKCLHCFNPRTRVKEINAIFKPIEFLFSLSSIQYPASSIFCKLKKHKLQTPTTKHRYVAAMRQSTSFRIINSTIICAAMTGILWR
jgi:hypothetical protein